MERVLCILMGVARIDTIVLLNGEKRKKISFNNCKPWIEGIGSTSGFFYPAFPLTTNPDKPEITCFKQNNTELYKATEWCPDENCCDLLAGIAEPQARLKRSTLKPNPTKDYTLLQFGNQANRCTSVEILDFQGNSIKRIPITGSSEYKLDLSDCTAGIYFVLVRYNDKMELHKIIKK